MVEKKVEQLSLIFLLTVILVSFNAESVWSIPAFARKYRMSCKTCHLAIPKLKPYGDEFAGNGFDLEDKEAPRYYVETGDEKLSLLRDLPFAIRMEAFIDYNDYAGKKSDLKTPYLIKLMSGGAISKNIAYYFYFFMDERGEVAGVEDAYLMFNNLFGEDLDIYLGQFQISDPLFKRELRLTLEDYMIYETRVGDSQKNLTYDRGIMVTYGLPTGTDIIFEMLNGNGIGEADELRNFDHDKYKDFMGRISQDMGEYVRIGAFAYYGRERSTGMVNKVWFAGPDLTLSSGDHKFELNFQYVARCDDNPFFINNPADDIKTKGIMSEMVIAPQGDESNIFLVALLNWIDSDIDDLDYKSITGHLSYLLRRNIRLSWEFTRNCENKTNRVGMGFVAAF